MFKDYPLIQERKNTISQFYPHIPKNYLKVLKKVFSGRWVGQGPLVDKLEKIFSTKFANNMSSVAVGSGTDALHLAYILSGIKKGDEIICPVFTCTATNIPLLYIGAKIKFADVNPDTLNISIESVKNLITKKTKAIVFVNYAGLPCELNELNKIAKKNKLILIQDAAQSLGATYQNKPITSYADYTIFSFQAIKHVTSGDGGMLVLKNKNLAKKALRIRWFGIDRPKKQGGTWENDIKEVGYKYQMTDIGASILLESIKEFKKITVHRKKIFNTYLKNLLKNKKIKIVNSKGNFVHAHWMFTIILDRKDFLQKKLRSKSIETNQVHFRNDKYSIFSKFIKNRKFKNMDKVENKYLALPIHTKMTVADAFKISNLINKIIK
ncbi:MAG TPA: DegT/DnrJ/EryC1/StrS family aminotransferase [Pelagibacteraceae bacterium]|jgi:dTDP-4-amino-4,6-dideoxygalactose transaminase|nr:DegT/DnrJ/EryC1/StrS family aminotransferase [Pelagibacteraceae bacterium]